MNILEKLANSNRKIVEEKKQIISINTLKKKINLSKESNPSFKEALINPKISFIGELKKASPSKGLIQPDFDYLHFTKEYEESGIDAISCLTEPTKFLGSLEILSDVTKHTYLPVLRKDFIIDPYQIYEAKLANASAVLLIVALLDKQELTDLLNITHDLNLDALVEVHNKTEIEQALNSNASIIGINNRDLKDFSVDLNTSINLSKELPDTIIRISESGIHSVDHIKLLASNGFNGVLIGEELMTSNIPETVKKFKNYED